MEPETSSSPKSSIVPPSPRASASSEGQPSSPRFASFHRRFQSSLSSKSSELQQANEIVDGQKRTAAARDAKQFLLANIKNDWTDRQVGGTDTLEDDDRVPLDYRYREEAPSDLEDDHDELGAAASITNGPRDPYRFETPDAIGASVLDRRKQKRRSVQEELQWNEGLQLWTQQRDVWTRAAWRRRSRPSDPSIHPTDHDRQATPADSADMSVDWPLSATSQPSSASLESSSLTSASSIDTSRGPLLPVYPPLIPTSNPVRASIKPSTYPTLYSKVVVQGLTPTVPIPLPDMVQTLINGWKDDGTWPQGGGTPSIPIINEGTRKQGHMLHFRRARDVVQGKGRVRRGVGGAVKKAFGIKQTAGKEVDNPMEGLDFEDERMEEPKADIVEEKSGNVSDNPFRVA